MARTKITPLVAAGAYPTAGQAMTLAAADVANGNYFPSTGKELLIAQNSGVSPFTVTVHSQGDTFGRSGDITAESVAAGAFHIFGPFAKSYWADSTGAINIDCSNAAILLAVITLP